MVQGSLDLSIGRPRECLKVLAGRWIIALEFALGRHGVLVLQEGWVAVALVGDLFVLDGDHRGATPEKAQELVRSIFFLYTDFPSQGCILRTVKLSVQSIGGSEELHISLYPATSRIPALRARRSSSRRS